MCNSEGEIMTLDQGKAKSKEAEKHILTVKHIRTLEGEIEKLMKQKAELQDQVDKYIDKEQR